MLKRLKAAIITLLQGGVEMNNHLRISDPSPPSDGLGDNYLLNFREDIFGDGPMVATTTGGFVYRGSHGG